MPHFMFGLPHSAACLAGKCQGKLNAHKFISISLSHYECVEVSVCLSFCLPLTSLSFFLSLSLSLSVCLFPSLCLSVSLTPCFCPLHKHTHTLCVCVCMCVCERERERKVLKCGFPDAFFCLTCILENR